MWAMKREESANGCRHAVGRDGVGFSRGGVGALLCLCEAGGVPSRGMYQVMMKHAWSSRKR